MQIYRLTKGSVSATAAKSDVSEDDLKLLLKRAKDRDKTPYVRIDDGVLRWTWIDSHFLPLTDWIKENIENPDAEVWNA